MDVRGDRQWGQVVSGWVKSPQHLWAISLLWLLAIAGITLFWHVGKIGLIDETEPLFVEAARQMHLTGDWLTPYFNDQTRFDKPPLIYWLMVLCFKLFGVSEWSARLPSVLSALALAIGCFYTVQQTGKAVPGRRNGESATGFDASQPVEPMSEANAAPQAPRAELSAHQSHTSISQWLTALLAATMVLLNPFVFAWGRTGHSDMLLTACFGGCLLAFFLGYAQPDQRPIQRRWYLAAYVLMALAVLTKGPVGLVLPVLAIALFLLYVGSGWRVLRELQVIQGAVIVLAISLPWYILIILKHGSAFTDNFFGYHNIERFTQVVNRHAGPWYYHLIVLLVAFFPWSVYLPAAIAHLRPLQRRFWQRQPRPQQLGIFCLIWFLTVLGFFTLATTKNLSYTMPLLPAAAILVALLWTEFITHPEARKRPGFWLSGGINLLLLVILAIGVAYSPHWLGNDPYMPNLGARIQQAGLPLVGAVIWGTAAISLVIALIKRSHWLWLINVVAYLAFLLLVVDPGMTITDAERQLPLRHISQVIVQQQRPNQEIVMLGFKKPSIVFYAQHPVNYVYTPVRLMPYLQEKKVTKPTIQAALVVAHNQALAKTGLAPTQYEPLTQAGVYSLVRVNVP